MWSCWDLVVNQCRLAPHADTEEEDDTSVEGEDGNAPDESVTEEWFPWWLFLLERESAAAGSGSAVDGTQV